MHILFVTPDLSDADLAQRYLERSIPGVRLDGCATPDAARARILTVSHDAAVVDVLALGDAGLQFVADCRAQAPGQPVAALTRTAAEDDAAMATVAGATTCIVKRSNWLEPLAETLVRFQTTHPAHVPVAIGAAAQPVPLTSVRSEADGLQRTPAATAETPDRADLLAPVEHLRHALDQEVAIRREAEARARDLAAAHDADRQRWQTALRQLEERYASIAQQHVQRSDLEAAFESVEQRYLALLEERRRDLRRLEVLEEQALRQRETAERLERERDDMARETADAREALAQLETNRARVANAPSELERERDDLAVQLARATDDLRQAAEHVNAIQAALVRSEREQQETQAQLEALGRRVESDAQALGEREQRVRELERALAAAEAEARDARADLEEVRQEFEEARDVARALTGTLEATRERLQQVERASESLEARLSSELAALRAELEGRQAELHLTRQARDGAAAREQALAAELSRVGASAQDALTQLELARADFEESTVQRAELERQLKEAPRAEPEFARRGLVGLATTTTAGVVVRANDAFARACGFDSASALLAAEPDRQLPFVLERGALAERLGACAGQVRHEAWLLHADGRSQWIVAAAARPPEGASSDDAIEWIAYDVTDTYLTRRQQRRIRRLDSACSLVSTAGDALIHGEDAGSPASALLRQVVTCARLQARAVEFSDLAELLPAVQPTVQRVLGAGIHTEVRHVGRPVLTELSPADAEHLLVGAAAAIREALPLGGTMTLAVDAVDAEAPAAQMPSLSPTARLTLGASGYGARDVPVPASLQDLVSDAGGRVRVVLDPATGTRLEIDLPVVVALPPGQ